MKILRRNLAYPLSILVTCLSMCATPGCATSKPPVYIPIEMKTMTLDIDGRQGWWVPADVYAQMLAKIAKENK
jgi:hypothetical protein